MIEYQQTRITFLMAAIIAPITVLLFLLAGCTSVPTTDSYCNLYVPVITDKGDGNITASIAVKRKLLANELTHRKLCP